MAWGCIRESGERLLVCIQNKVNSHCYIKILQDHVLNFLLVQEIFQQVNAPAHRGFFREHAFVSLEN